MKITKDSFHYIVCKNEKERQDCLALLELLDFKKYDSNDYDFSIASHILINSGSYQTSCSGYKPVNISAKDFIRDNF